MKCQMPFYLCRRRFWNCGQVFIIMACLCLCSCAMVDTATQKMGIADIGDKPEPFYVGLPDLKLFPEPRFCDTVITKLPLNEKVLRDKVEKGFAHVTVVRTDQRGWVENRHLVWKKASPSASPPKESAPPQKKPPEENVIQQPVYSNPEREGRDAAIFNRF